MKNDVSIIIPAYNPDEKLEQLVKELKKNEYNKIIVIDDGSIELSIFKSIKKNAIVLHHRQNKGKGRALKTGFEYCLENMEDIKGVITVDADGQHAIEDINKIYKEFQLNSKKVIIGSRNFQTKGIPLKSKIGNNLISKIIGKKYKVKIRDTQTGLRAISIRNLKRLKQVKGEHFEYETNMIIECIKKKIKIIEVPIKTIYLDKNKASHFKNIRDSIKICKAVISNQ